jgi:predicted enzyme related to lactoylglutathione lyase
MSSLVHHITVDCADPYRLATFWSQILEAPLGPDDVPGDPEVLVDAPGVGLLFIQVPEPKTVKNRLHLDLRPQDRPRDEEIERVLKAGAVVVDDQRNPDGTGWAVMADPEGNEFCVVRSAAEREKTG